MSETRLCLSVRQPWAWLIVHGWKHVENRTWSTKVRGHILIQASLGLNRRDWQDAMNFIASIHSWLPGSIPGPKVIDRGGIVGSVYLGTCVSSKGELSEPNKPWFTGPFGFVLSAAKTLPFRPMKGRLGFFTVTI